MLYIVATPIGNLSEITYRAVEILKNADLIAAEDTRHTAILLKNYGIQTPMIPYHKFNEKKQLPQLISKLKEGKNIALVSDAGMPLISDPGYLLTKELDSAGIGYTVISGACALINALILSGMDTSSFCFGGFLPEKKSERIKKAEEFVAARCPVIFYSSVHNVEEDLATLFEVFGRRKVAVIREISKIFEETVKGYLGEFPELKLKGEFVIVVEGVKEKSYEDISVEEHIKIYTDKGMTRKEAIKKVAADRKVAKSVIYKYAVKGEND